ncbi:LacI family DNA-binding transcriptional regulator [Murimonas intestini]|uniref:LacI family transcriptional regulator n=1 Tax=Murimonas intestini TaxID=1337051 RepID=A0AB73SZG6_9FIRM|nr:LacI family DNA-binding transcriptional regulator [Murimonas intestini]MCR1842719.1 LacI family transcriptional regulator [Murimonas intestini]MCR1867942.1 LacI family transcriptional regulator [Murimonas intestini]MCR1885294.1 LacI family transcriptional regulator [Murimonas intestini]
MAITIKDVAKETNLAISTISKYMNGGPVRQKNKKVIEEAVRKLGYNPNKAARGLRSSRTYMIGVVLDSLESQYFGRITARMEQVLKEKGYSIMVCCHRDSNEKAKKCVEFMVSRQVDGILILSLAGDAGYMDAAINNKIPIVALDRVPETECDSVGTNAATGAYQAVEYLVQQNHKKIAVISGTWRENPGLRTANERLNGYYRVFEDYCLKVAPEFIVEGDFSFDSGYKCMTRLWELEEHPTAVFVTNYNMTMGAMTAIHNLKIKVPEELSIVVFDDLEYSSISRPKLTSVRQPAQEVADESVKLLMRRIEGDYGDFPKCLKLPTTFHIRNSVREL